MAGPSKQPPNALVAPPAQRSAMDQEKRRHRHILCRPAKALSAWRNNAALRMVLRFALGSPLLLPCIKLACASWPAMGAPHRRALKLRSQKKAVGEALKSTVLENLDNIGPDHVTT